MNFNRELSSRQRNSPNATVYTAQRKYIKNDIENTANS